MSVIKLRGLPWSCTVEQIVKFLNGIKIVSYPESGGEVKQDATTGETNTKPAVYLTTNAEGRPSGEAFVEVDSEADLEEALKLNNNLMGQRYIEIFRSDTQQLKQHTQESMNNASNWSEPVLRLRGLPYGCTKADIETFFQGLVIAYDGIMMVIDFSGRFNGEAFVQFETISDAHKALERHKQKISNRYIEIFRSNFEEMNYYAENSNQQAQNGNNSRGGGGGKKRGNLSMNSSRRDSRSDSSMFFDGGGSNGGNNRFNPYARNGGGSNFRRNNNNGNSNNGPTPLMGGGGFNNNNNNFNNNSYGNNYDDDDGGGDDYNDDYDNNGDNNDDCGGTGFLLKMRGLPFKATDKDIYSFFDSVTPINIYWNNDSNNRGRPSGECECEFETEDDLSEAMKFDKKYIGTRYIELFNLYESNQNNGGGNNRRGGFNNNNRGNNNMNNNNRGLNNSRGGNSGGNGRGNFNNNDRGSGGGGNSFKGGRGGGGGGGGAGGGRNNNNTSNSNGNGAQSGAPQSLNSLMNQSFNGNANSGNKNNAGANPNKTRTPPPPPPVPPPMPMMMPVAPVPPQAAMNNFMMTDMAQKMFTAAYSQFQQQQLQYGGYNPGN